MIEETGKTFGHKLDGQVFDSKGSTGSICGLAYQ